MYNNNAQSEVPMNAFSVVLFIHVLSAITLFIAITLEGVVLARIRSARQRDELRSAVQASRRLGAIYGPAFIGILGAGIYLAYQLQIKAAWIPCALVATLVMGIISGTVTGTKMSALRRGLAAQAASFGGLSSHARSNFLLASYGFRAGLAVGIVFLMSATPALVASIVALVIASILGMAVALLARGVSGQGVEASKVADTGHRS